MKKKIIIVISILLVCALSVFARNAAAADSDGDGFTDDLDLCPNSNLLPTITLKGCDAGVENQLFDDGCTMADHITDCYVNSTSYGQFVSCSEHFINDWRGAELITSAEQRDLKTCMQNSYLSETQAFISGTVFDDVNGNGKQDDTESGISGVAVTLDNSSTVYTTSNGGYSFLISQGGTHTVTETDPDGFISTTPNTLNLYVVLGQYYIKNFGDTSALSGYASIFGMVFNDTDQDGVQDAGETGIPWVIVALDGAPHTTNAYGEYTFQITQQGMYRVTETDPAGAVSITPNDVDVDVFLGDSYQVNFGDFIESSTTTTVSGTSTTTTVSGSSTTTTASGSITTTIPANSTTTSIPSGFKADFTGNPLSGSFPLVVQFTNLSSGDITSYLWDFGDMGTSIEQNPTHTYSKAGNYTVSLRAQGSGYAVDEIKTGYISVKFNSSTSTSTTPTTTTVSGTSTTTSIGGTSTTTSIPISCSTDAECEDDNFCNGTESCVAGFCVSSGNPCDSEQQSCSESLNTCVDIKKIEASTAFLQGRDERKLRIPILLPKLFYWLRVIIAGENNVDLEKSLFSVEGPNQNYTGVTIDNTRFRKTHRAFLKKNKGIVFWVPISVSKNATPGTWKIKIETSRTDAADPFIEIVEGRFVMPKKLFQK